MQSMSMNIHDNDVYYPLIWSPFGLVPLLGGTMTDEQEKAIAKRYPPESEVSA